MEVCNDGSSDGTAIIDEVYNKKIIGLIRHAANQILAAAQYTNFRHTPDEFIVLSDADDIALQTRLAEQVAALKADDAMHDRSP